MVVLCEIVGAVLKQRKEKKCIKYLINQTEPPYEHANIRTIHYKRWKYTHYCDANAKNEWMFVYQLVQFTIIFSHVILFWGYCDNK